MAKPRRKLMTPICVGAIVIASWVLYVILLRGRFLETVQEASSGGHLAGISQGEQTVPASSSSMIRVLTLPSKYLPQVGNTRASGRLIVVGDVHGMLQELTELLDKVQFEEHNDHLILAGDIINKGPDSAGVVDLAMKMRASVVRGNHEDRIIRAYAAMNAKDGPSDSQRHDDDMQRKRSKEDHLTNRGFKDQSLAKHLGEQRVRWLENCPEILRLGALGEMGEVVVVHAGLEPGVDLLDQDPHMVMNMRTISNAGVPSKEHKGDGWMKAWNSHQSSLPKNQRMTVIYGHDSKRGLQIEQYSMGIDTGCVKGGRLTALVIEGTSSDYTSKLVQVDCRDER